MNEVIKELLSKYDEQHNEVEDGQNVHLLSQIVFEFISMMQRDYEKCEFDDYSAKRSIGYLKKGLQILEPLQNEMYSRLDAKYRTPKLQESITKLNTQIIEKNDALNEFAVCHEKELEKHEVLDQIIEDYRLTEAKLHKVRDVYRKYDQDKLEAMKQEIEDKEEVARKIISEADGYESQMSDLQMKIRNAELDIDRTKSQIQQLEKEQADKAKMIKATIRSLDEVIQSLPSRFAGVIRDESDRYELISEELRSKLLPEVEAIEELIRLEQLDHIELKQKKLKLTQDLTELKTVSLNINSNHHSLEQRIKSLKEEIMDVLNHKLIHVEEELNQEKRDLLQFATIFDER